VKKIARICDGSATVYMTYIWNFQSKIFSYKEISIRWVYVFFAFYIKWSILDMVFKLLCYGMKKPTKKPTKKITREMRFFARLKKNKIFTLILCLAIPLWAGIIGSRFTMPAIADRYVTLIKPSFTAPNRLFGPIWTILFILMWVSLFWTTRDGIQEKDQPAMRYFVIQLFLNILWSIVFFYMQNPLLAFIEIIVLWVFIVVTAYEFSKINKKAWWLFLPYILRVLFAGVLNYYVMILN